MLDFIEFKIIIYLKMLDSKTSSQLIRAFTETKHNMDLNADKKRFADFQEVLKTRAKQLKGS